MAVDPSDRTKWIYAQVDEDTHRALCRRATETGFHPSELIDRYVTLGLMQDAEELRKSGTEMSVDLRVFNALQDLRRGERIKVQLQQIAYQHLQKPSEETADLLNVLCEEAGLTVEEVISEARDATEVPLTYDDGRGVASAMSWLKSYLTPEEELAVRAIEVVAEIQGFSKAVLKEAKRRLGVVSRRKAHNWVWVLPPEDAKSEYANNSENAAGFTE